MRGLKIRTIEQVLVYWGGDLATLCLSIYTVRDAIEAVVYILENPTARKLECIPLVLKNVFYLIDAPTIFDRLVEFGITDLGMRRLGYILERRINYCVWFGDLASILFTVTTIDRSGPFACLGIARPSLSLLPKDDTNHKWMIIGKF